MKFKNQRLSISFNKLKIRPILSALLILSANLSVQSLYAANNDSEKNISVVSSDQTKQLQVSFIPSKDTYTTHEPIQFKIQGNQTFFLYVYSENTDGSYTLILPNRLQSGNKYQANDRIEVPNKNLQFIADGSSSSERVYAIASTRYIDLESAKQKKSGDFSILTKEVMQDRFSQKGIDIRNIPTGQSQLQVSTPAPVQTTQAATKPEPVVDQAVVVRVDLNIKQDAATQSNPTTSNTEDAIVVFVSSDRSNYKPGDRISFVYGASEAGEIDVYFIDPAGAGANEPVISQKVDGKQFHYLSATHEGDTGEHKLKVVYRAVDGSTSKALKLDSETPAHQFTAETSIMVTQ